MRSLLRRSIGSNYIVADLLWLVPSAAFMGFAFVMAWAADAPFVSAGGF